MFRRRAAILISFRISPWASVLWLFFAVAIPEPVLGVSYQFTKIADGDTPSIDYVAGDVAINNNGMVAFRAYLDGGIEAVLIGDGTTVTRIADDHTNGFSNIRTVAINDRNDVAIMVTTNSVWSVVMGNGNSAWAITTPQTFAGLGDYVSLNNSGVVAVKGRPAGTSNWGIYTTDGTTTTVIADSTTHSGTLHAPVAINNAGLVAFKFGTVIFASDGLHEKIVFDQQGPGSAFVAVNDNGWVAFSGKFAGGTSEDILRGNGEQVVPIVTDVVVGDRISINDHQTVCYAPYSSLWVASDAGAHKVIGPGDQLFGKTVSSIFIDTDSLNNADQLAFYASFTDGGRAIVLATPIPEPSILVLLGVGALSVLGCVWRPLRAVP